MIEEYSDKIYNSLQNNHGNLLSYKKKQSIIPHIGTQSFPE